MLVLLGTQVQSVALQWEIYERTEQAIALGLVGLVQIVPALLFLLPAGHLADSRDRRGVVTVGMVGTTLTSLALAGASMASAPVWLLYLLLFLDATFLSLARPARSAMLPLIVPEAVFGNAVTWNSSLFQLAMVVGPALGGLVVAWWLPAAYLFSAAGSTLFAIIMWFIALRPQQRSGSRASLQTLLAGMSFVRRTPLVLAAISLDMFAVLLGGAVYLLPIFAKDILQVGEWGFGLLRAAPAVGALLMALVLAHTPPMRHAGRNLLLAVAGFGLATIIFGVSRSFWLSLVALALTGALDNISVVIRHTLVQLATPDSMRGRVSAVNSVFIGLSNELGGFESGLVAQGFGPVVSVVSGGIGTIAVVAATAVMSPTLRQLDRVDDAAAEQNRAS